MLRKAQGHDVLLNRNDGRGRLFDKRKHSDTRPVRGLYAASALQLIIIDTMAISFSLIAKAVDLATRVFVTVRDANSNTAAEDHAHLAAVIDDVARKIDSLATDIAGQVSAQLEKQQLEKLSAQAKVVKLALEFGNEAMLGTAVASISEQIEYSRLRLAEDKHAWFGPWLIAEAVRIEALRIMAHNQRALDIVQRETRNLRISILNHVGKLLIGNTENPWLKIADFVDGRNEDLLLGLGQIKALQVMEIEYEESVPAIAEPVPVPAVESALMPAAPWPFATSSRP